MALDMAIGAASRGVHPEDLGQGQPTHPTRTPTTNPSPEVGVLP